MLFGGSRIKKEIIKDALEYADKKNIQLVYGAMVGGISRGLQYQDSDYDTRFLYVNKDFPSKINIPEDEKEDNLVYRHYPKNGGKPYEWIPCWELTSFLQFAVTPKLEGKFSSGLYNLIGWTFLSPYTWDPYGLQNKIVPLLSTIFTAEYAINYHMTQIELYLDNSNVQLVIKDYLYGIYAALAIDWILKYNNFNPIYMRSLLIMVNDSNVKMEIEKLLLYSLEVSNKFVFSGQSSKLHDSHFVGTVERSAAIDTYVNEIVNRVKTEWKDIEKRTIKIDKRTEIIKQAYEIIDYSIKREQKVRGVSNDK